MVMWKYKEQIATTEHLLVKDEHKFQYLIVKQQSRKSICQMIKEERGQSWWYHPDAISLIWSVTICLGVCQLSYLRVDNQWTSTWWNTECSETYLFYTHLSTYSQHYIVDIDTLANIFYIEKHTETYPFYTKFSTYSQYAKSYDSTWYTAVLISTWHLALPSDHDKLLHLIYICHSSWG